MLRMLESVSQASAQPWTTTQQKLSDVIVDKQSIDGNVRCLHQSAVVLLMTAKLALNTSPEVLLQPAQYPPTSRNVSFGSLIL